MTVTTIEESNLALIRRYFAAFGPGAPVLPVDEFYEPDAVQVEFPNRFSPNGVTRDLAVAVEATWEGTLAVAVGDIRAGTTMRARFANLFELRNGRIIAQRNYDCFEPW